MTDSPSHDQLEAERLNPDQRLMERRKIRDEEDYRAWCESLDVMVENGMVEIGQEQFHLADVLEEMAPDAARRGRDECSDIIRENLKETVCELFPAPIAVPFHSFLEGPRSALTRLHRLKDTWESLIRFLAALALSEAATIATPLKQLRIRSGVDQGWRECMRRDLVSEKLSVRIGLIEGILHLAQQSGIYLQIASLLPVDVLGEIRRLNVVRNSFSHESAKSEIQARELIEEAYPLFCEVMLDLRDLQNIELIRIHNIQPGGGKAEVERLNGHAQSLRIRDLDLNDDTAALFTSATRVEDLDRVFARVGGLTLDLSPFLYAAYNDTGHLTKVWDFKFKKSNEWHMECVADSTNKKSPAAPHEDCLGRFGSLLERIEENGMMSEDFHG